jgi:hypothetical protein
MTEHGLVGWHYHERDLITPVEFPDNSHVDVRQKAEFTRLLTAALRRRDIS